jgi:hypothetical protein
MKKLILFSLITLFTLSLTSAGSTCLTINSKTTSDYLNELSSLNSQLSSCSITVPSSVTSIISDGNMLVSITMNSGPTEQFYISIVGLKLSAFTKGAPAHYTHEATLSEDTFDKILQSSDATNEILMGINNNDIIIRANSFFGKIKWFFAKFFLPKPQATTPTLPPTGPTGKPDNCDETYLPGHREYANNKELWDRYSSNTDKVCQSQTGRGIPSPCIHSIQLSISGTPYYLCWYNE